jgi:hypothetical protein
MSEVVGMLVSTMSWGGTDVGENQAPDPGHG